MAEDPTVGQESVQAAPWSNGLLAHRDGLDGWIFETVPAVYADALARHELRLQEFERLRDGMSPGMRLALGLVFDDANLTREGIFAATGPTSRCYRDGDTVYLEWARSGGWRGRCALSQASQQAIARHGGARVSSRDWEAATDWIHALHPSLQRRQVWAAFFGDAGAWWYQHLTGPAFAHLAGLRPLQVYPRAVLARRATGHPQVAVDVGDLAELDRARLLLQTSRSRSAATGTLEEFGVALREIVQKKGAKPTACDEIAAAIDRLLPRASNEGRAQVLVLLAVRHLVVHGGIRGKVLAPRSLLEYLRKPLEAVVNALSKTDVHWLSGEQWFVLYRKIIEDADLVPLPQRKKLEAFFEAFHRFMVINGAEPLQRSVAGKSRPAPPIAAAVTPAELEVAVRHIYASDCSDEVKQAAELGLRLANWVPMRIEDLWCLRKADVHVDGPCWIAICPRERDGYGKSPSLRRQADVEGTALIAILRAVYARREREKARDEDVLLGEPGVPDGRHEEELTTSLMNEALRYATGNPAASFHDLRHTRISELSEPVFSGLVGDSDVDPMQCVSAAAGHAGPGSTVAYQHVVEKAIARQAALARPDAWLAQESIDYAFEDVAKGLVAPEPLVPGPVRVRPPRTAASLTLAERAKLLHCLIEESSLKDVASICRVSIDVVETVLKQMCAALQWARLATHEQIATTRLQAALLRTFWLHARPAKLQAKHIPIENAIHAALASGRWSELESVWHAWVQCQEGADLNLTNTPAAARFVRFLLKAKVPHQTLLVVSHDLADPLPPEISQHRLAQRVVVDRGGRQCHRLQICEHDQLASEASGASVSVLGVHWWMLILGSMILSHGEHDD